MVNSNYLTLFIGIILLACQSCSNSFSAEEYKSYVLNPKNGFRKSKTIGELKYDVLYKPHDYVPLVMLDKTKRSYEDIKKIKDQLGDSYYFDLRLSVPGSDQNVIGHNTSGLNQIQDKIEYLSYQFENDIHLIQGSDTTSVALYNLERAYDLTPYRVITLAFPKKYVDTDCTLVINAPKLGCTNVKFKFPKNLIEATPSIIL